MMKLYCFGESGNAYKAALSLELAGLDWEPVYVDFFHGETRTPAYRALNPRGKSGITPSGIGLTKGRRWPSAQTAGRSITTA